MQRRCGPFVEEQHERGGGCGAENDAQLQQAPSTPSRRPAPDLRRAGLSVLARRARIEAPAAIEHRSGIATTAAFVLLFNEGTAAALHFCAGVSAMIALVAVAGHSPPTTAPSARKALRSQR